MDGEWHFVSGCVFFTILWLIFDQIKFTMIFCPIALTMFPDVDFKFKSHRNFLFHCIIPWVFVWYFFPNIFTALCCFGIGLHLLLDITLTPSKWKGGYTIKLYDKGLFKFAKGKQGVLSTLWLLINFIFSFCIFIYELILKRLVIWV